MLFLMLFMMLRRIVLMVPMLLMLMMLLTMMKLLLRLLIVILRNNQLLQMSGFKRQDHCLTEERVWWVVSQLWCGKSGESIATTVCLRGGGNTISNAKCLAACAH